MQRNLIILIVVLAAIVIMVPFLIVGYLLILPPADRAEIIEQVPRCEYYTLSEEINEEQTMYYTVVNNEKISNTDVNFTYLEQNCIRLDPQHKPFTG